MGIINGRLALTRFKVLGLSKNPKLSQLNQAFLPFKHRKLRLQGVTQELSIAWCRTGLYDEEHDDHQNEWDLSVCQIAGGFLFALRIEQRRVPSRLLQMVCRERLHKKMARREKPISVKERRLLWREVKDELTALALPTIQDIDVYWNTESSEILIASTSKKIIALFEDLFQKSFIKTLELELIKIEPPLIGLNSKEWESDASAKDLIAKLTPTYPTSMNGSLAVS